MLFGCLSGCRSVSWSVTTRKLKLKLKLFTTCTVLNRLLSLGPPYYAMHETYKLGTDPEPPKPNLSKRSWGFYSPPPGGECVLLGGCGCHSRACMGAVSGGAAYGRARLDTVDTEEIVQPLDSVEVELC
jgi:hypothetical protein